MTSASPQPSFATTLSTTLHLISQFSGALSAAPTHPQSSTTHSPLPLLKASSTALKQNVTRLSLLTLTPPFATAAVGPLLNALNTSILPSLVTASHLITPATYTKAFSTEAASLTAQCLSDLKALVELISQHATSPPAKKVSTTEKNAVTQATGQVWARCDALTAFADGGLAGFMTQRVGQWLELMRDAVKELEDWDPEEEVGDDPFGIDDSFDNEDEDEKDDSTPAPEENTNNADRAILQAGVKAEALKVLTRIPQSIHVVLKQRLSPSHLLPAANLSPAQRSTLDTIVTRTRKISESIDESAEAMYMGDLERCLKMAGEARSLAISVVESVQEPWKTTSSAGGGLETSREDVYIKRALYWIRQVKPKPGEATTTGTSTSTNGITGITDSLKATNLNSNSN